MITIKLNIKDKEIELTIAEAELVHKELSNLLGKHTLPSIPQVPPVQPYLPQYNPPNIWYVAGDTPPNIHPQSIKYTITS